VLARQHCVSLLGGAREQRELNPVERPSQPANEADEQQVVPEIGLAEVA
jgi:hypothetical protein